MVPTGLDHIILGTRDLDRGIAWVEERTGVRAALGGVHPGRGTRNALLALGPDRYLEIIAPDPEQSAPAWFTQILALSQPKLIAWAAHISDVAARAQAATSAGIPIDGPRDGARSRPDGRILSWRSFRLHDDRGGLLPFFIEWGRDSPHPATDAPSGCRLVEFHLQSPNPDVLKRACRALSVDVYVHRGEEPGLVATIASPHGEIKLAS